ncbi:MAG TPA: inositol monophosphatase family protein [Dermatophilaceae bacterium]|nr:inositol monophosphatase family protein [Dermatophilaceae bacterium]
MDTGEVLDLLKAVAADVITPRFRSLAAGEVMEKGPGDLVTVADHEAEVLITRALTTAYPDAVVLGEEAHAADHTLLDRFRAADHGFTVDPVDGTKNFVHGIADHAVMVAEVIRGETVRSWIWQPEHAVGWVAERGAGVFRDGVRMHRAPVPVGMRPAGVTSVWSMKGHALDGLPPMRLSWVCCGVDYPRLIEGAADYVLWGRSNPWDHAPGSLMVLEAGGAVGHPDGTPYSPRSNRPGVLAAADPATYAAVQRRAAAVFTRR